MGHAMLADRSLACAIVEIIGLELEDLNEYFLCLAYMHSDGEMRVDYEVFIRALKDQGQLADMRSMLRLSSQVRALENMLDAQFGMDAKMWKPASCEFDSYS